MMIINKNKYMRITRHRTRSRGVHVSSIVDEVIRGNFKLLYFFLRENFTHTKSIKKHKNVKQVAFVWMFFTSIKKHKNVKQSDFFLLRRFL